MVRFPLFLGPAFLRTRPTQTCLTSWTRLSKTNNQKLTSKSVSRLKADRTKEKPRWIARWRIPLQTTIRRTKDSKVVVVMWTRLKKRSTTTTTVFTTHPKATQTKMKRMWIRAVKSADRRRRRSWRRLRCSPLLRETRIWLVHTVARRLDPSAAPASSMKKIASRIAKNSASIPQKSPNWELS